MAASYAAGGAFNSSRRLYLPVKHINGSSQSLSRTMQAPIFIVGPHRAGSTLWHNLVAMCPGIMRLTDPRFLSDWRHTDFRYFLRKFGGDLAVDQNVDHIVGLCFSKKHVPGLDSTFWRFKNIEAVSNPDLKRETSRRIKQSDRSLGAIAKILVEEITRFS